MKHFVSKLPLLAMIAVLLSVVFSGCVEHRYYKRYKHYSRRYYDRCDAPPPPGVDFYRHH